MRQHWKSISSFFPKVFLLLFKLLSYLTTIYFFEKVSITRFNNFVNANGNWDKVLKLALKIDITWYNARMILIDEW